MLQDVRKKVQAIHNQNTSSHVLFHGGYDYLEEKLMEEKKKKRLEEAAQFGSIDTIVDPPSLIRRHVKWKMTYTKKSSQMTSKVTKEIIDRIASDFHLSVTIFYNNCWMSKPNLFHLLTIRFPGKGGLTWKFCCPWTLGCTDTLVVSMLLEPVPQSNNTLDRLQGAPKHLHPWLLKT